ncbi:hypothetical protein [Methylomonas rapida]|uniref:Uncharacterized protein n=1 Tax=Methylomonas rapida TaxID=2963939 RepID=A0ABY7GP50_9GAMM|nr:hypothetical protein [Methylomonas rapida]WAR46289.1 hypothetical protein NM686_007150 [Methylomonas rapida]
MATSYQIASDLTEKQIEADVSAYFGRLSPFFGQSLRLLDINEQLTGADKLHKTKGIAFYFQFKAPIGLKSVAAQKLPVAPRKNESKLMGIRRFRHTQGLLDSPYSICFNLHDNKPSALNQLQHNVLFAHERPPFSRAMYICPTVLHDEEYVRQMQLPWWRRPFARPFYRHEARQLAVGMLCHELSSAPFLRAHATIVPHALVASADHYYSFSKHATDYAFHSPIVVDDGDPLRLSDFLSKQVDRIYSNIDSVPQLAELVKIISAATRENLPDTQLGEPEPGNEVAWLQAYGQQIKKVYGIRQVIALVDDRLDTEYWRGF